MTLTLTTFAEAIKSTVRRDGIEAGVLWLQESVPETDKTVEQVVAKYILSSGVVSSWRTVLSAELRTGEGRLTVPQAKVFVDAIGAVMPRPSRTDFVALGTLLAEEAAGSSLYASDAGLWFHYNKGRKVWEIDHGDVHIKRAAEVVVADLLADESTYGMGEKASEKLELVVRRSQTADSMILARADFDSCPQCLNTPAGYYSLSDDGWAPNSAEHLTTKITRVAPATNWRGGVWEEFLTTVQPAAASRAALQRMSGYALLGGSIEKAVFFLKGKTNTGKTLFLEALTNALGDYGITTDADTWLITAKNDYGQADLPGARLVSCAEFDQEMRVNTSLLKRFTGGDLMKVRQIYGKPFQFKPQATMVIATNNLPWLGSDAAAWVRVYMLEFTVGPLDAQVFSWEADAEVRTPSLLHKLQEPEIAAQVLAWALEGVEEYHRLGLAWPVSSVEVVAEAKAEQRHNVERWIDECVKGTADGTYNTTDLLYKHYRAWAEHVEGVPVGKISQRSVVGRFLKKAGYNPDPDHKNGRGWDAEPTLEDEDSGLFGTTLHSL